MVKFRKSPAKQFLEIAYKTTMVLSRKCHTFGSKLPWLRVVTHMVLSRKWRRYEQWEVSYGQWGFIGQKTWVKRLKDERQKTKDLRLRLSSFDFRLSTDNEQWEVAQSSKLKAQKNITLLHYYITFFETTGYCPPPTALGNLIVKHRIS